MKIYCTKDEFSCIIETCFDNRHGADGCNGCLFGCMVSDESIPCSIQLKEARTIVPDEEDE